MGLFGTDTKNFSWAGGWYPVQGTHLDCKLSPSKELEGQNEVRGRHFTCKDEKEEEAKVRQLH